MATITTEAGKSVSGSIPINPTAFWLSVTGLIFQGVSAAMIIVMFSAFGPFGMMGPYYGGMMGTYYAGTSWFGWMAGIWLAITAVVIGLGVTGVLWMNSADVNKFRSGAIVLLVAAIVAFPTMWGFGIGSILMFVGAILGLTITPART